MLLHNQILPREGSRYTPAQFLALFGAKKFIQRFGTGLTAAYFLADLGSSRGTVDGVLNPVVRVRRSSDGGLRAFTAADIKSGTALDYVNNGTSALYNNAMYFDGVDDYVKKDVSNFRSGDSSGSVTIDFAITSSGNFIFVASASTPTDAKRIAFGINAGKVRIITRDSAFNAVETTSLFNDGQLHTVKFASSGTAWSIEIDGNSESLQVVTGSNTGGWFADIPDRGNIVVGALVDNSTGGFCDGLLKNLIIKNGAGTSVLAWAGDGNQNSNWLDTSGNSYNPTVFGSPALYSGQPFGSVQAKLYDGLVGANDATQTTVADMPKTVVAGARVVDNNGNASTLWEATDNLTFTTAFTGLTSANVYAVTDNAGTVTLNTITAFDISAITTMTALLTSLTYTKVTAVIIAPDNANQAAIQAELNRLFGI
jgi:hypothetical protein